MSIWRNYFGPSAVPAKDEKKPIRALPASWYTSEDMYELERRSIFSRKWLLTTHKHRVPNIGDCVHYDAAGYEFTVAKDNNGTITAFHSNDIFPVHVHIDRTGFVWVNLDINKLPEVAWNDDFEGVDEQPRFEHYNFEDYNFDHTWEMEGEFNWKILADNYNECYHCKVAHPDIPTIADLNSYYVKTKAGHIQHYGAQRQDQIDKGFRIATTYFWPNASVNISPHFFFMQRFTPTSPTQCVMRYEVYRHKDATDEAFNLISDMYKRIMSEDKYLCMHTQKNLNAGIFVNGQLHPEMEQGPLHFQKTVREVVTEHYAKEEAAGHQIWPAKRDLPVDAAVSQDQENDALRTGMHSFNVEVDTFKDSMDTGLSAVTAIAV
ncbi:Naphthalene 1,2-dioxygenase subunit alpha [Penicillium digitatum]|uniref:Choline monooxygenase, chloroplastic n=3 Tax=Penicillium digitatum TaxID=36651 RepID=K9G6R0_PEND2|nr:Naphthalene 1,2-dioxygenase subunit alpha [Penicillium digitatum Pd1]EKV16647.1 Naphthalene 1,2-dioxygenase subunit alpha [Penicillium digitatum PHI26]EKV22045.1 Naphthalene 1,2-dioxygenase subunit alpha [Penicillium digitatum Pd1]QQK47887.1 Naphthalene 1,2-dioxygenase subunit alpha [Penicillium digitatum]